MGALNDSQASRVETFWRCCIASLSWPSLQCLWPNDVLLTGSCSVSAGVGRISSPVCRSGEGEVVKCEGLGPTPNGWVCSEVTDGEGTDGALFSALAVAAC